MTPNRDRPAARRPAVPLRRDHVPVLILVAATAVVISLFAPSVWLVVLTDGWYVAAVLAAAAGWGAWPVTWLGLGHRPTGQQYCVATALGLGILSTLTLTLGVAGWLNAPVAWVLLALGGFLGLLRAQITPRAAGFSGRCRAAGFSPRGVGGGTHAAAPKDIDGPRAAEPPVRIGSMSSALSRVVLRSLALLPLCVPLAVALFGATLPPGVLWTDEARGYDALEYHLQSPREYFDAGRIHFLPHNVYAAFPQQMEMLYLLLMHLGGDPLRAAIPAQLLHAALGLLTVVALSAGTAPGWSRILVALTAGSVPWLAYLGCLAYVELGLLFFAAVSAGLVVDHAAPQTRCDWRIALAAGLCAGLAGACKYTALGLVAAALAVAWLLTMHARLRTRVWRGVVFGLGVLVACSPWLIRNAAFTGNPVYPFAYKWLGGAAWSAEQDAQWARGHRLPADQDSLPGRVRIAADELFTSGMYGVILWALPAVSVVLWPARRQALAAIWLVAIVGVWAALTHMPGRFAVPLIVPLALMVNANRTSDAETPRPGRLALARRLVTGALVVAGALGAADNDVKLLALLHTENEFWHRYGVERLPDLVGDIETLRAANPINRTVPDRNAYVWLVGDAAVFYVTVRTHYTVAFSRDPWLEFAARPAGADECVAWLRTRNVTHVVFSWDEIKRLRRTYGFSPVVTPEWVIRLEGAGLRRLPPAETQPGQGGQVFYEVMAR